MEQLGFISEILDKLKSKSSTVAINVSSRSLLEVLEFNKDGLIINYASVPIQYNAFTKELENVSDFESAIKRAFSEINVGLTSRVYVSLPTFIIDHETLPDIEEEEAIKTMLVSSVEKNYIFKKYDPAISFYRLPEEEAPSGNVKICYTALRADEYSKMKGVFEDIGLKVLAIDSSFSSLINGVIVSQKVNPSLIAANDSWNIINITSNSFSIFSMKGKNLVGVYEEPLAVKSFTEEEVYQVITNSLDLVLGNYPAKQVVVVSQSDDVSAEYLASVINVDYPKTYIEDNKFRRQIVEYGLNITQSNKVRISLEAIGIANWVFNQDGFKFDFLDAPLAVDTTVESIFVPIGGRDIELTPELIKKIVISFAIVLALIIGLIFVSLVSLYNAKEKEQIELVSKIQKIENELNLQPQATGMSQAEFLQKSYTNNLNYKKSYSAIAREIPDMLWIEEFQMAEDSKLYLAGRSYRMDDVLNYYDSLNKLGKFPNLKISVLKISNTPISELLLNNNSDMVEETTYEFALGSPFYRASTEQVEVVEKEVKEDSSIPAPPTRFKKQDKE